MKRNIKKITDIIILVPLIVNTSLTFADTSKDYFIIKFISFHKGIVRLLLSGSCSGCAMSKITLHRGVEDILKHYVPEVEGIIGEDDEEAKGKGYEPYFPKDQEPDWKKLVRHEYE